MLGYKRFIAGTGTLGVKLIYAGMVLIGYKVTIAGYFLSASSTRNRTQSLTVRWSARAAASRRFLSVMLIRTRIDASFATFMATVYHAVLRCVTNGAEKLENKWETCCSIRLDPTQTRLGVSVIPQFASMWEVDKMVHDAWRPSLAKRIQRPPHAFPAGTESVMDGKDTTRRQQRPEPRQVGGARFLRVFPIHEHEPDVAGETGG